MLLDTHVFLWWLFDDPQLPESVRRLIQNMDKIFISSANDPHVL
jgi:PIN domain nuclease of toxin-antitoxin system